MEIKPEGREIKRKKKFQVRFQLSTNKNSFLYNAVKKTPVNGGKFDSLEEALEEGSVYIKGLDFPPIVLPVVVEVDSETGILIPLEDGKIRVWDVKL